MTKAQPNALSLDFVTELEARTNGEAPQPVHNWGLVLRNFEQLDFYIETTGVRPGIELRLAIAIRHLSHDPRRKDNLFASCLAAPEILKRRGFGAQTERVTELMMFCRPDRLPDTRDLTGRLMRDIDRTILGVEPAAYDIYRAALRAERVHLSDGAFNQERGALLMELAASRIYLTDFFRTRYEKRARENILRELHVL